MTAIDDVDLDVSPELERAAERAVKRASDELDKPLEPEVDGDRTKETRTPGFSRMRTSWHGHDAPIVQSIHNVVEGRILKSFVDVYMIMEDIFDIVRDPVMDGDEVRRDGHGFPVWAKSDSGRYIEDYSRLGHKERETFLFQITTRLFDWEQRAAEAWGEAMLAKAQWEETYAEGFLNPDGDGRKTDATREASAKAKSRDERYFAIFVGMYSRKADALVRSMERIAQRLKDTTFTS